jgi:hypothetical protein
MFPSTQQVPQEQQQNQKLPWWARAAQVASGVTGSFSNPPANNPISDLGNSAYGIYRSIQSRLSKPKQGQENSASSAPEDTDDGTIVTKPTLVMLGDQQPEAVVPLSNRQDAQVRPSILRRRYYGEE